MKSSLHSRGVTSTVILAVFTSVIGTSFHLGYASGVTNAPQTVIESFINETNYRRTKSYSMSESTITLIFSFAVAIFALGGMIGGLCGNLITDRIGRKGGMFVNNIVSCVACLLMFLSKIVYSYELIIIGRFFIGLSCGYGTSVAPTYINEVSPRELRGAFGVFFQLGVVISLLFAQVISLNPVLGSADKWNYALGLQIIFSIIQLILLFFVPESPKYLLIKKNDLIKAKNALQWLRQHSNFQDEISEMEEEQKHQEHSARLIDLFRTPTVRWALFIIVFLHLSQQLTGMDAVFFYSTVILKTAGYDQQTAEYSNLGIGGALIVVTIISLFLIDWLGRRILHLIGLCGMLLASLILVISLIIEDSDSWNKVSLTMTILFVTFFAIGPGAIPWLVTSELFNQTYRVPASSIAAFTNWAANFTVVLGFKPLFTGPLDKYTFFIFSGFALIFSLLTFFFLPETKAKTVDEIYKEINAGQVWRRTYSHHTKDNQVSPNQYEQIYQTQQKHISTTI